MINKDRNVVLQITITKEAKEAISMFAEALKMTKSEFIESVCMTFISDVAKNSKKNRQKAKKEA